MDNVRLFLWLLFAGTLWFGYTAWVADHPPPAATAATTQAAPTPADQTLPPLDVPGATPAGTPPPAPSAEPRPSGELIHVRTDVLDVYIDSQGGDLVRADLLQYPVDKKSPDRLVRLLDDSAQNHWVFQTGLRSAVAGAEPNHIATFRSASNDYSLAAGQNELVVTLDWVGDGTLSARKTYTFRRGQYGIDLALSAQPAAGGSWRGAPYVQMVRMHHPPARSYTSVDSYSFTGPVLYDGDRYEKLDTGDLAEMPRTQSVTGGWFAAIEHHFLAAAVPPAADEFRYDATMRGQEFLLSAIGPINEATATTPLNYSLKLFVGPKLQEQLKGIGEELDLTVDYGRLTILAQPLFWLLSNVEVWVNNWGWAIVIVTILIKLAFYKLTAMSGRSMAKMRRLAPRMKTLQERYKDDRQALSQAMMELYKKEKVNPAAGCLPILIQMPFFFAFYWVLVESVEMRQAPFMLWVNDLSARDPYFVLPLLMGVAMFFQTKLNPAPPDPMQARVMQIMPIIFTAFFLLFPSGLVLYWLTNTALSMLQQWRINKIVAGESSPA
jgi:YidC/Oxa1 family membrane protein insertase